MPEYCPAEMPAGTDMVAQQSGAARRNYEPALSATSVAMIDRRKAMNSVSAYVGPVFSGGEDTRGISRRGLCGRETITLEFDVGMATRKLRRLSSTKRWF
jgi:hypothetical protein